MHAFHFHLHFTHIFKDFYQAFPGLTVHELQEDFPLNSWSFMSRNLIHYLRAIQVLMIVTYFEPPKRVDVCTTCYLQL